MTNRSINHGKVKDRFLTLIKTNIKPYYFNTSKTELRIRCPYCGDSIKNSNSAHLYIEIVNPDIFPFYCQRCNSNGVVTPEFMKDIKIYDFDFMAMLLNFNKNASYRVKSGNIDENNTIYQVINKKTLEIPPSDTNDVAKITYLNTRIGLNLTGDEWIKDYKIVFNLAKFLKHNELPAYNFYNRDFFIDIVNNYVGFLSHDSSHIVFRNIDKTSKRRYFVYNVFNQPDGSKIYVVPTALDLLSPSLNLIMTEGCFDILGVKNHLYDHINDLNNTVFVSANGKGYNYVINYFARMGFLDMDIDIYSDSEVSINFYQHIKNSNDLLKLNKVKIHYNSIYEDFGTTKDKIKTTYNYL